MRKKLFFVALLFSILMVSGTAQDTFTVDWYEPESPMVFKLPIDNNDEIFINGSGYNDTCDWRFSVNNETGQEIYGETGSSDPQPCDEMLVNPEFPQNLSVAYPGAYEYPHVYTLELDILEPNVTDENEIKTLWIDNVKFSNYLPENGELYYNWRDQYGFLGTTPVSFIDSTGYVSHNSPIIVNISFGNETYLRDLEELSQGTENVSVGTNFQVPDISGTEAYDYSVSAQKGEYHEGLSEYLFYDLDWEGFTRTLYVEESDVPYITFGDTIDYNSDGSAPTSSTTYGTYKSYSEYPLTPNQSFRIRDFETSCDFVMSIEREWPDPQTLMSPTGYGDDSCNVPVYQIDRDWDTMWNTLDYDRAIYKVETEFLDPELSPQQSYGGTFYLGRESQNLTVDNNMPSQYITGENGTVTFDLDYSFLGKGTAELYVDGDYINQRTKLDFDESGPEWDNFEQDVNLNEGTHSYQLKFTDENDFTYWSDSYSLEVVEASESYVSALSPCGESIAIPQGQNETNVVFDYEVGAIDQTYDTNLTIWNETGGREAITEMNNIGPDSIDVYDTDWNLSAGSYNWTLRAYGLNDGNVLADSCEFTVYEESTLDLKVNFSEFSPEGPVVVEDLELISTGNWRLPFSVYVDSNQRGVAQFHYDDGSEVVSIGSKDIPNGSGYVNESITIGEGMIGQSLSWFVEVTDETNSQNVTSEVIPFDITTEDDLEPEPTWFGNILESMVTWVAGTFGTTFKMGRYLIALFISLTLGGLVAWMTEDGGAFTFTVLSSLAFFTLAGWFPTSYTVVLGLIGAFILSFFSRNMMDWNG